MAKLTLSQLENHLFEATNILHGEMAVTEYQQYIFGMLLLKRASDVYEAQREAIIREQREVHGCTESEARRRADKKCYYKDANTFFVPEKARWPHLRDELHHDVGSGLNQALRQLERQNDTLRGVLDHIDFNHKVNGKARLDDATLCKLIRHFSQCRLRDEDFSFPDMLDAAYEYLIKHLAGSAGKKSGEFYTPREVVRLMVRLIKPQQGMHIYDPCVGPGGMLLLAREYVAQSGGDPRDLAFYGQEGHSSVWAFCKMNLLLHGIPDADIRLGDTLTTPLHLNEDKALMRFDRVISYPPFSQDYDRSKMLFQERFRHGFAPEKGKKAALMFLQHITAVLKPGGLAATVMPHGVLSHSGAERDIRAGILNDDLLEAVIGLPPHLFCGINIPACILVLRAPHSKPPERRQKVLFINADAEYHAGQTQNTLQPEHIEKIVASYEEFQDIPGYARVVGVQELVENEACLTIRRYVDNTPPPEPHDVRAHLQGGVPAAEVKAQAAQFKAVGLNPNRLFIPRPAPPSAGQGTISSSAPKATAPLDKHTPAYLDFNPEIRTRAEIKARIKADPGVQAQHLRLKRAFESWWTANSPLIALLRDPNTSRLSVRTKLLHSFEQTLAPLAILDRLQVKGAIATWWSKIEVDLRALDAQGSNLAVIDSWIASIRAAMENEEYRSTSGDDPLAHPLVEQMLPGYLAKQAALKSQESALRQQIAAGKQAQEDEETDPAELPTDEQLQTWHREQRKVQHTRKALQKSLNDKLDGARAELDEVRARRVVLDIERDRLAAELRERLAARRQALVTWAEALWDKYRVSLRELEASRDEAAARLESLLEELGHAG